MDSTFRQLVKHTTIFGIGTLLFRAASILLLPVYTRYLTPSDYGVTAVLDLTISLLAIVVGGGFGAAATRAHYQQDTAEHLDRVWWTAAVAVSVSATLIIGPAFLARTQISSAVFGPQVTDGAHYLANALATLWVATLTQSVDAYFRAGKASSFVVGVGMVRLLINIALNLLFLIAFQMGVAAVLYFWMQSLNNL